MRTDKGFEGCRQALCKGKAELWEYDTGACEQHARAQAHASWRTEGLNDRDGRSGPVESIIA